MQSAAMNGQPPPSLPGFAFPTQPFLPPTPQLPAPPMSFPPQTPQQHTMAASDRIQEVMDSDREDGEVSDGEIASQVPVGQGDGPTHSKPPRSVPQAKPASPRVEEGYNPDRPAAGQMKTKEPVRKASSQAPIQPPVDPIQRDRDQAKQFIKLLHSNNIGYHTLAKEPLDLDQLRGLYQSLNLPSEPAPILPPKEVAPMQSPAVQPVSNGSVQQPKPVPAVKTAIQVAPAPHSAPSPVDRRDYIARLQAAKLAKQAGVAKPSPPQNTPPVTNAPAASVVKTPQSVTTPTPKPPVTDEQRARTTELIKQRLEAMRAGKKPPTPAAVVSASVSSVQKPEADKSLPEQAAQRAPSGATTPSNQSYNAGFSGIPGLFMQPPTSLDNTSKLSPSVPQKRPAAFDSSETSTPRGSITPYTRPLGDSPHAYHEEPMIIEVSDDESNGSDMDIDDDQIPPSKSNQRPGTIPNFPSQPTSAFPGSSAASTPGPQTPATQAREKELKRKEDQLAAMKETLKKKLAEKRAKDKAAAAASSPAAQSALMEQNSITTGQQVQLPQPSHSLRIASAGTSGDAMHDANELIRDVKRRRREEIELQLPSFDVELASKTSRIAELMEEMEALRAQSKKIAEDKERLTHELESLGVDTEGMSHKEMRAKKDEIEQEIPSEPTTTAKGINLASAPGADASVNVSSTLVAEAQQDITESEPAPGAAASIDRNGDVTRETLLPGLGHGSQQSVKEVTAPSQASLIDEATAEETAMVVSGASQPSHPHHHSRHIDQAVASEELIAPTNAIVGSETQVQSISTPVDEDDFYSPAPADKPNQNESLDNRGAAQVQHEAQVTDAPSPSEEGEVEMSLSSDDEEEEYEPEEPMVIEATSDQGAEFPEGGGLKSVASDNVSTEDEEAYEPPDIDEGMPEAHTSNVVTNGDMIATGVEAEDGAMDIASSSSEDLDSGSDSDSDSDSDSESDGETAENSANEALSPSHAVPPTTNVADDLAPELQPETAPESVRALPANKRS